nr:hypothetical protein P5648_20790 [Bacillus subtilis]WGD75845.1 hypothetical protein P5631_21550 [Bacillus subtilis]
MNNPIQKHLIDSEFTILKTDFQFFKKEFILYLEMDTKGKKQRKIVFYSRMYHHYFFMPARNRL